MRGLVRLGRAGVEIADGAAGLLGEHLERQRALLLEGFLEGPLLARAQHLARTLPFREDPLDIGVREICDEPAIRGFLMLLLNRPALFRLLEEASGGPPLRSFEGTLYRLAPGLDRGLDWHDDDPGNRRFALSLGLGAEPVEGGVLELRSRRDGRTLFRLPRIAPGDAALFQVAPDLEHRVTPVRGTHARVNFAGWFLESPPRTLVRSPERTVLP